MKSIRKEILLKNPETLVQCISEYKKISSELEPLPVNIKIASVCSFTLRGFDTAISFYCAKESLKSDVYSAPYNSYSQEILNPESGLYAFSPDIVFLWLDTHSLAGDSYFNPLKKSADEWRAWAEETAENLLTLISRLENGSKAAIVVHSLEKPVFSPIGILEKKQKYGIFTAVDYINERLTSFAYENAGVFVFDTDSFYMKYGRGNLFSPKWYYLGDMKISPDSILKISSEYMAYILPRAAKNKKCIVLDLDNTLWGGIIGEDGISGIRLGPSPDGRCFSEFQQMLLALFKRGIILAVNSKNNPEDALNAIKNHPYMILREKHFAAMRINWNNKASNLAEIASELNIGTDSLVFFDDDPANRQLVRELMPEVEVPEMPSDPVYYPSVLQNMVHFNTLNLTEEDYKKGEMYYTEKQRKSLQNTSFSQDDFVRSLDLKLTVVSNSPMDLPRVSQLTLKTNQFNMTSFRYTEDDIKKIISEGGTVYSVRAQDKFGDYGIIGAAIVRDSTDTRRIDTFLLSCRIIGRSVEDALFIALVSDAVQKGIHKISAEFIPSAKNAPAKDFYSKMNGRRTETESGILWEWVYEKAPVFPDILTVIRENQND
jgi:FkbH-like protein